MKCVMLGIQEGNKYIQNLEEKVMKSRCLQDCKGVHNIIMDVRQSVIVLRSGWNWLRQGSVEDFCFGDVEPSDSNTIQYVWKIIRFYQCIHI